MEKMKLEKRDAEGLFTYEHKCTDHPQFMEFFMHTHADYEVFIFIKGDTTFAVEGVKKKLSPYDMVLVRGNELHRIFPNPEYEYERIVINISDEFFLKWKCEYLHNIFHGSVQSRFISGDILRASGIDSEIQRIEQYIKETKKTNDTVVKCGLIGFLHAVSRLSYEVEEKNSIISEIIKYININITQQITLDRLASRFLLSKYHMCRLFKESTGFTINQYIIMKRIMLVRQLYKNGMNLSAASIEAGFGDYTCFYKAYVKEFGVSPKQGLKKK